MNRAPIALFVYNRLDHTRRTVEALRQNDSASESDLYVFSDAPKTPQAQAQVSAVRQYVRHLSGFKSVSVIEREANLGLARSIISGVTSTIEKHGRIIVLEDDMITSRHFLSYMNLGLDRFANDKRVISIHGYVYPVAEPMPEAFFLQGADCWGWATWTRGWSCFNPDGQFLLDELTRRRLIRAFDFDGAYPYSDMLRGQIKGTNDSWAIRWYASAFLAGALTLYPGRSFVHNIGNDNSGTHCESSSMLDVTLADAPITLDNIAVEPSEQCRRAFAAFFRQSQPGLARRLLTSARSLLSNRSGPH